MSQLPAIDYDFDNPCDWDEFLDRVEERVRVVNQIKREPKSPNSDAHPKNPPHMVSMMWQWMGGE